MRRKPDTCRMTPGASMLAAIQVAAPSTRSAPTTAPIRSAASIPFWSPSTTVSGPSSGSAAAAAPSMAPALTHTSTSSTGPISSGRSVAVTGATVKSPCTLCTRRPDCFSAARCAPRATNPTACPA